MDILFFLKSNPMIFYSCLAVTALCIGSFLALVTDRLPIMLFKSWHEQCQTLLSEPHKIPSTPFNLFFPRSQCPACHKPFTLWQWIPLLSFILQRGQYACCHRRISWRYPLIEGLTLLLTLCVALHFGFTIQTLPYMLMTWFLLAITWIDLEYQIIPDELNLTLIWLGLLSSLYLHVTTPAQAIIGVISGYLFLWIIGHLYHLIRKQDGIGYGDYKLFAAFGAWFGWQALPIILLIAATLGSIVGIILIRFQQETIAKPLAFGPYLAVAGWCVMMWQPLIHFL